VLAALLAVGPPDGSLVFACEAEVLACSAGGLAFVALLAAQAAGEASYKGRGCVSSKGLYKLDFVVALAMYEVE
jgi:hypothetical protein